MVDCGQVEDVATGNPFTTGVTNTSSVTSSGVPSPWGTGVNADIFIHAGPAAKNP